MNERLGSRHIIPDFDELLSRNPPTSEAETREAIANIRGMMQGLLCGLCVLEARIDLTQAPAEWQAVTIVDGTALCVQHVILKARADAQRRMTGAGAAEERSLKEHMADIEERLRQLEQAIDAQREYEREVRDRGE